MGNAVAAKVAPRVRKEDTRRTCRRRALRVVGAAPAPEFHAAKLITEDSMTQLDKDDPMAHLDWHAFLVHTDLCTMNYDCLGVDDDTRLRHLVRMVENLKVASTNKAPVRYSRSCTTSSSACARTPTTASRTSRT